MPLSNDNPWAQPTPTFANVTTEQLQQGWAQAFAQQHQAANPGLTPMQQLYVEAKNAAKKEKEIVPDRRPETGTHVISVAKIRNLKAIPQREIIDKYVDEFSEHGAPVLSVFWDAHGWDQGFVAFSGDAGIITALRELGFTHVTCNVTIHPSTGLAGDSKVPIVDVVEIEE